MRGESRESAPEAQEAEGGDLELGIVWSALARRRSWILVTTAVVLCGALLFVFGVKPRYTADSQVLIENQENFFTRPDPALANPQQPPDDAAVASQIQLLTSRDLARKAIAALGLAKNPEFNPHADPGLLSRLAAIVGLSRAPSALSEEDQILQNYYDRLTVFQVAKSRVLEIDFTSTDPALAARAANQIADLYIDVQIAAKRQQAQEAAVSLKAQMDDLQSRLTKAEDAAESFRMSSGLLLGSNNMTLSSQQLADLNTQLAAARTAQADAKAKAKLIRDALAKGRLDEISDIANNQLIRQIAIQRVTLRAQLAQESRTLLPEHPQIKELEAQLRALDSQLRAAAMTVARGLENDAQLAEARYESIRTTLDQQKQTVGDSGANQVRMRALDRNAKLISDQLEATTEKYQEAVARETATSTPGDARVISRAIPPLTPSFPRKVPTLVFAALAALVLSSSAALAAEFLGSSASPAPQPAPAGSRDERVLFDPLPERFSRRAPRTEEKKDAADSETAAIEPNPRIDAGEAQVIARLADLRRQSRKAACMIVLGLSDWAEIGQWAAKIGRRLSADGRAIVVETRRGLLRDSGLDRANSWSGGLGDLIAGDKSFAEVIERDDRSRLHVIAAGDAPVRSGEPLDMALEALGETYDFVILLLPPVRASSLALELAAAADLCAILRDGEQQEEIDTVRAELLRAGAGEILAPTLPEQKVHAA